MTMSNSVHHNLNGRPTTPEPISWFEFLLDEHLLEQHLTQENPDPSASELITRFLYQADTAVATARELTREQSNGNGEVKPDEQTVENPFTEPKKAKALRLLALKTVAFVNWNLDTMDKGVPLAVVAGILQELLKLTTPPELEETNHSQLNLQTLSEHMLFALQLYHRWCIRTVISESFPVRPTKVMNVQVPGLLDPTVVSAGARELILKAVHESVPESVALLSQIVKTQKSGRMPTMECFAVLNENTDVMNNNWSLGHLISPEEMNCQISFDLGCIFFLQEKYSDARSMFAEVCSLLPKMQQPKFCTIPIQRLTGYCLAVGLPPFTSVADASTLLKKVEDAKRRNYEGVTDILLEDNQARELSLQYRVALEEELSADDSREDLYLAVCACNVVRRLQENQAVPAVYMLKLATGNKQHLNFLLKVLDAALKGCSMAQQELIKSFIKHLSQQLAEHRDIQPHLLRHLDPADQTALAVTSHATYLTNMELSKPKNAKLDPSMQQGQLEHELRRTYDPVEIRNLIGKLLGTLSKQQIIHLSDKWRIPTAMSSSIESSVSQGAQQVYMHILVAKARICLELHLYEEARTLLQAADTAIKDTSFNLPRLVRWEMLLIDLRQFQDRGTFAQDLTAQDLGKKAKTCITSQLQNQDVRARNEIVAASVAYILTMRDWDYLTSLSNSQNGYLQISRLLAALCKELPLIKNARKPSREFWDVVVQIFVERSPKAMSHDQDKGILSQKAFIDFIRNIRDQITLSTLISCITKLFNILKDDITCEISSDYLILWPTTLNSASTVSLGGVVEAMSLVIEHALTCEPAHPSWLRTQADIHYAHNQFSLALRYYLESGVVATQYFSEPVPKNIFDEMVYRRLIRCCNYLQCYTQVAVLCQFLEEIDYSAAFKALQERSSHDAMDSYYPYFWDVTILEYLINLHTKRGEMEKRQQVLKIIGYLELNSCNPPEILKEAARIRQSGFLRSMAKQYF